MEEEPSEAQAPDIVLGKRTAEAMEEAATKQVVLLVIQSINLLYLQKQTLILRVCYEWPESVESAKQVIDAFKRHTNHSGNITYNVPGDVVNSRRTFREDTNLDDIRRDPVIQQLFDSAPPPGLKNLQIIKIC